MKIGYLRVSTQGQQLEGQEQEVGKQGIEKWFIDKASGRNTDREQFQLMMDFCREGDIIYCYDFSRISRSLKDLLNIIDTLNSKGVSLVSIKENLDTSTSPGRFMVQILGAVNEYQINLQREKIMDGIEEAKRKGKYKGRKKITIENFEDYYNKFMNREIKSKSELARILNISRQTLYNLIEEFEKTLETVDMTT